MNTTGRPVSLRPRSRRGTTVSVHLLTWDFAVLVLDRPGHPPVYATRSAHDLGGFLDDVEEGGADAWLERVLTRRPRRELRRVPRAVRSGRVVSVGVEHEYTVVERGEPVDFKALIHGLGVDGIRADPVDPNAYRCGWGGVVTADGIEAEIATPPVPLGPDAVGRVVRLCELGRNHVQDRLGVDRALEGFSTHVNVTVPERGANRRAVRYGRTFGPGLMLLLDRCDSPGLLVRPRPHRLELCGEFAEGSRLGVALTYAVATTLALVAEPRGFSGLEVRTSLAPSRQRYGHHLAPDAFGGDLYGEGRAARLVRRSASVTAQQQLEQTWERSRRYVAGLLAVDAVDSVDRVVHGTARLPEAPSGRGA